ncbi:MAG: hypothetical protein WDM91_15825 [Rhizomicrobium sp.]
MSISSVGAAGGLSQGLAALLAQLTGTKASAGATGTPPAAFADCAAPPPQGAADTALTGSAKGSLSDEILALLTQLQQQAGTQTAAAGSSTGLATMSASTAITAASSASDPLGQLFAAMDGDGDGTVSQSEMETYIEKQGGTAAQGDALFAGLDPSGSGNLTQTQLANDLQQAQGTGGAAPHHHHHHRPPSADQVGNDLLQAMDGDGSGAVDQSEFENFVTGLGGTTAQADSDFSALDPTQAGSVNASQFASAVAAFQAAGFSGSGGTSPVLNLLDAFRQDAGSPGSAVSVTA